MLWNSYERMGEGEAGGERLCQRSRPSTFSASSVGPNTEEGEEKRGSPLAELDLGDGALANFN